MKQAATLRPMWHGRKLVRRTNSGAGYQYYSIGRRPTFKGTRVEVKTILDCASHGRSIEDIVKSYPALCRAAIEESIDLAAQALAEHFALKAA
jgi:uncharacterized protein (DUF433 family)